jgi:hypothetical protein
VDDLCKPCGTRALSRLLLGFVCEAAVVVCINAYDEYEGEGELDCAGELDGGPQAEKPWDPDPMDGCPPPSIEPIV